MQSLRRERTDRELLRQLSEDGRYFGEAEITRLASLLDRSARDEILDPDGETPYRSKDLRLGTHREQPLPLSAAEGADRPTGPAAMEQFDPEIQKAAFEFVKSEHRIELELTSPRPWIRLKGVGRSFYHYQLYGAFWMLLQERGDRRGVIEADRMGLGKTTIAGLYVLLNSFLCENAQDIKDHPERHCGAIQNLFGNSLNSRCPSSARWPIGCACESNSVARRLRLSPRPGATLVLVPKSLLGGWDAEWQRLGVDPEYGITMYVQHHMFGQRNMPRRVVRSLRLEPDGDRVGRMELTSTEAHRVVVLTTVESYYSQVQRQCQCRCQRRGVPGYAWKDVDFTDGLAWGRVIRDEAHLTPNWDTTFFSIVVSLAENEWVPPNLVLLTATPMLRNGVVDMLACVRAINLVSPQIGGHPRCAPFKDLQALDDLAGRFDALRRLRRQPAYSDQRAQAESRLGEVVGRLQLAYCIRRSHDTVQNGKRLALIPPLACLDVRCTAGRDQEYRLQMSEVEHFLKTSVAKALKQRQAAGGEGSSDEVAFDMESFLDQAVHSRILASVPELVQFRDRRLLTWNIISANNWHRHPERSPHFGLVSRQTRHTGKLQQLLEIFSRLGLDASGEPEKLVVVSEFPAMCFVVLCLFLHHGISADWMHAEYDATEREAITSVFQGLREMDPGVGLGKPFRVLIGSSRILGQGLTLNKANRLILVEPCRHAAVEAQIADRVHRIGSRTDRCWFYRLINPDSTIEGVLTDDQQSQSRLSRLIDACSDAFRHEESMEPADSVTIDEYGDARDTDYD